MKLELKHIAGYLPYKLKLKHTDIEDDITAIVEMQTLSFDCIGFNNGCDYYFEPDLMEDYNPIIKPVLHPMADLYKPCFPDGKTPIEELAKIGVNTLNWVKAENENRCVAYDEDGYLVEFKYLYADKSFVMWRTSQDGYCFISNQLELFQKLYEWHFDVFGLIENDLAVDINTIKL